MPNLRHINTEETVNSPGLVTTQLHFLWMLFCHFGPRMTTCWSVGPHYRAQICERFSSYRAVGAKPFLKGEWRSGLGIGQKTDPLSPTAFCSSVGCSTIKSNLHSPLLARIYVKTKSVLYIYIQSLVLTLNAFPSVSLIFIVAVVVFGRQSSNPFNQGNKTVSVSLSEPDCSFLLLPPTEELQEQSLFCTISYRTLKSRRKNNVCNLSSKCLHLCYYGSTYSERRFVNGYDRC